MISHARTLGNVITIGIDSDDRVKKMKGENRPFHNQDQRKFNLRSIRGVDNVWAFNTDDELRNLIKFYRPDIFLIGSDYKNKPIIGSEFAKEIIFFDRLDDFSTTNILSYEHNNNR
jgi:D-beta-D-heptose 7-phosphate kinase/D-beta-D-heptose 1-phosphate adenosyltransferase